MHQDQARGAGCKKCANGKYAGSAGSIECTLCEAGKYRTYSSECFAPSPSAVRHDARRNSVRPSCGPYDHHAARPLYLA